jgi:uncharacterized protein (TIGR01319 family)
MGAGAVVAEHPTSSLPSRAVAHSDDLRVVLATDCGSTTTKAVLFERTSEGWRQTYRGEAPTTVEKPVADVTIGARNAFLEIQELSGRTILDPTWSDGDERPPFFWRTTENPEHGIDLYVSTSSAGGGLQMIVAGIVGKMSCASAERAALGAGAIVMDAFSIDDGREAYERVQKIRHLRPDIVLISGGTDKGAVNLPLELAETVLQADPRPRFGDTLKLPVVYAGNTEVADQVQEILKSQFAVVSVANLRPTLEEENLGPARDEIHEIFLNHVMSHAPGYSRLLSWSPVPIIPTPAAVGDMVRTAAERDNIQIVAVDIGGATTDVFSVFRDTTDSNGRLQFNRTVSANLGMSYSVANVLLEAGEKNISRWLPFALSSVELRDRLRNKMIRPTSIPQTKEDLLLEQAVCREALRLAFSHHRRLATGLKGISRGRGFADMFISGEATDFVDMLGLDLIIGSGGVLSHAPNRVSSAFMLIDAYEPLGVTRLAVDSIFMMPHLGVFATVHPAAAVEVFVADCIVELGTVIAPIVRWGLSAERMKGQTLAEVYLDSVKIGDVIAGRLQRLEFPLGKTGLLRVEPSRGVNVGAGYGKSLEKNILGGHAGIVFDGRGRPLVFPAVEEKRVTTVEHWYAGMEL